MFGKKRVIPVVLEVVSVATTPKKKLNKPIELMPLLQKGLKHYGLWPTDHPNILKFYAAAFAYMIIFTIPMVHF